MVRSVVSKVMWVGRATVFLVGLAVILALIFGVLSRATAHPGSPGLFHLNHNNPVTALSTLTGNLANSVLKVDNNGAGPALSLEVGTDKAPLTVNSTAGTATNLSADKLDGRDSTQFTPTTTYVTTQTVENNPGNGGVQGSTASCDQGDVLLSGGVNLGGFQQELDASYPAVDDSNRTFWQAVVTDNTPSETGAGFRVVALCADLGAPHTG